MSSALTIALLVAIGFPLLMYLVQDQLLFHPQPLSEPRRAEIGKRFPTVQEIVLEAEGRRLHAWHVRAAPGKPYVLYFGGNAEDVSWMIDDALIRVPGTGWLLVSYPGYGGSDGAPSEATITAAALRWYDHAVKELGAARVVAFGRSLGSGAAVALAAQRKVDAVVLVTPFDSLVEVARHHYPYLPVRLLLRHPFDSAGRAPNVKAPLLCIAAGQDTVIPAVHAKRLHDAWGGQKQWIELQGADHNNVDALPAFWPPVEAVLRRATS